MSDTENRQQLNHLLRDLADTLDVSPSKYAEAKDHYKAVGDWLNAEDSELAAFSPEIYAQGSFALGTAVRPLGDDEYDVDAVCLLDLTDRQVTQCELKEMVGRRLKHRAAAISKRLSPRMVVAGVGQSNTLTTPNFTSMSFPLCLTTSNGLRLLASVATSPATQSASPTKILPIISLAGLLMAAGNTIPPAATLRVTQLGSKTACVCGLMKQKPLWPWRSAAGQIRASVEDIEDYEVRTPMQRVIQILKRHRDVRYNGDDDRPISIIITTLAAKAYDNEANLYEAILKIVPGMRQHIEDRDGVHWVPNPVNPLENFADKWEESPRKAKLFYEWLDAVEREYHHLISDEGFGKVSTYIAESYGERAGREAMAKYASRGSAAAPIVLLPPKTTDASTPNVSPPKSPSKPWRP